MAWIYQMDVDAICIDDHQKQTLIGSIWHVRPENDAEDSIPLVQRLNPAAIGEIDYITQGVGPVTKSQFLKEYEYFVAHPFENRVRSFSLNDKTPVHPKEYDLDLSHQHGLVRKIWTRVPKGKSLTYVFHKIAGRGDAQDFYTMARYVAQRLPNIAEEVVAPRFAEVQRNMRDGVMNQSREVKKVDWKKAQQEIISDFYNMFRKSVEYSAVEPTGPFRLKAADAKAVLEIVAPLQR